MDTNLREVFISSLIREDSWPRVFWFYTNYVIHVTIFYATLC